MVEHALREGLAARVGAQISSETWRDREDVRAHIDSPTVGQLLVRIKMLARHKCIWDTHTHWDMHQRSRQGVSGRDLPNDSLTGR